jgi:hypothetical protein
MDNHSYQPEIQKRSNSSATQGDKNKAPTVICKTPSQAMKIKDLASNVLGNADLYEKYSSVKDK